MASTDLDLGRYKLGWSDAEDYVFKPKKGLERRHRPRDVVDEGRARLDARLPPASRYKHFERADAQLGRRHVGDLLRRHLLLHQAHRRSGRRLGRAARLGQEHLREAGHPRGRAQVPRRRHRPVRVRGRLPPQPGGPRGPGRHLHRHGHRAARAPRARQAVLRHDHPARTTTSSPRSTRPVWSRRLVHLRAAGRERRDAAAGLLPHQRREHGPVRAHADHRRRGLARCTTSRAARPRCTPPTRCTRPWSRSSSSPAPGSPTRPSRTGRTTSSTSSPSGPGSRPRATWSGSTATSAAASP